MCVSSAVCLGGKGLECKGMTHGMTYEWQLLQDKNQQNSAEHGTSQVHVAIVLCFHWNRCWDAWSIEVRRAMTLLLS